MWDLPLRIFHWAFAISIIGAFVSGKLGHAQQHIWFGYSAAVLLLFRLFWGFLGGYFARFQQFVVGPKKIITYLRKPTHEPGHNPLGAWSVVAILLLVGVQLTLGFFADDGIFLTGPWSHFVTSDTAAELTRLHKLLGEWLLPAWLALHLVAIGWHEFKGQRLVQAMIRPQQADPQEGLSLRLRGLILLGCAILIVWWAINL